MKTLLVVVATVVFLVTCTSLPPQVRPSDPAPLLGEWDGWWLSTKGSSGTIINVQIDPVDPESLISVHTKLSNATVPAFSIRARFVDGELVFESPTLDMVFRLHKGQLVAEYHNKRISDKGTWHLKRKE